MSNQTGVDNGGGGGGGSGSRCGRGSKQLERLPESIIDEILQRLDLDSLCSTACVSRALRSSVSQILSALSSVDISAFSADADTLHHILHRLKGVKIVTIDCLRLNNSAIIRVLGAHIQELNLLKGSSLSYSILTSIAQSCPNLRVLALEFVGEQLPEVLNEFLIKMLKGILFLESLSIKLRGTQISMFDLESIQLCLPKSLKFLKLQPVSERDAIHLIHELRDGRNLSVSTSSFSFPSPHLGPCCEIQRLSLVLDVISDEIIFSIVNGLPHLIELNLEDKPFKEPHIPRDLTNNGVQSLRSCQHLTVLSIMRSRQNYPTSFKRVNDLGMFLLSENFTSLECVSFAGFSKVTDAGFSAILHSCKNLRKFEVRNASLLSDLALHNMAGAAGSLVELRLLSCNLITSDAVEQLVSCSLLEVLDVCGCRSISDACISYLASFSNLTTLNLGGADITDRGLAVLGNGHSPIARLCLRGCKRITDKGIYFLLFGQGIIKMTLSSLDMGHMPGISDKAVSTIASAAHAITELCLRNCFFLTDTSFKTLASETRLRDGSRSLQRLDLFHCPRLSTELVDVMRKPSFRNLRWFGAGLTSLTSKRDELDHICKERPWLTLCFEGCEIGCHDGWQFH